MSHAGKVGTGRDGGEGRNRFLICRLSSVRLGPVEASGQSYLDQSSGGVRGDDCALTAMRARQPKREVARLLRSSCAQHDRNAPIRRCADERREHGLHRRVRFHATRISLDRGAVGAFPRTRTPIDASESASIGDCITPPRSPQGFLRSCGSCPACPRRVTSARSRRHRSGSRRDWKRTVPRSACRMLGSRHA